MIIDMYMYVYMGGGWGVCVSLLHRFIVKLSPFFEFIKKINYYMMIDK